MTVTETVKSPNLPLISFSKLYATLSLSCERLNRKFEECAGEFQKRVPANRILAQKTLAKSNNCTIFVEIKGVLTPNVPKLKTLKGPQLICRLTGYGG